MIDPEIDHEEVNFLNDNDNTDEDDMWKPAKDKTFNIGIPFTHKKDWSLFGDLEQFIDDNDITKKPQKKIIWSDKSKEVNKSAPTVSDGLLSEETKWTEDENIPFWLRLNRHHSVEDGQASYKQLTADAKQYTDYQRMKEEILAWRSDFTDDDSERMIRIITRELIFDTMSDIIVSIAEECRVLLRRSVDMLSRAVLRGIMDINDGNQRFLTTSGRLTVLRGTIEDFISNRNGILAVSSDGHDPAFDKLKTFTNNTSTPANNTNKNTQSKASILDIDDEEKQRLDLKQSCQLTLSLHYHTPYVDYTLLTDAILREVEFLSKMTYKPLIMPKGVSLLEDRPKKRTFITAAQLFSLPSTTSMQASIFIVGYQNGTLAAWRLPWNATEIPERMVVYTPTGRGSDTNSAILQLTLHYTDPLTIGIVSENGITSVFRIVLPQFEPQSLPEGTDTNNPAKQAQQRGGFFSRLFSCGRNRTSASSTTANNKTNASNIKNKMMATGTVSRVVTIEAMDLPYQLPPSPADFDEPNDTIVKNKKRVVKVNEASDKDRNKDLLLSLCAVSKQTICIHPAVTISGQAVAICLAPSSSQYTTANDSTVCIGDIFKFNFDVLNNTPEPLLSPIHTAILHEEYVRPDQAPQGYLLKPALPRPRGNYNRVFREICRFHTSPLLLLASVSIGLTPGMISVDETGRIAKWTQRTEQLSGCLWWMPLVTLELSKMTVTLQKPPPSDTLATGEEVVEEVKEPDAQHVQILHPQSVRYEGRGTKTPSSSTEDRDAKLITTYFPCLSAYSNNDQQDEEQEVIIYQSTATLIGRTESTVSQITWTRSVRKLKKGEVKVHAARLSQEGLDLLLLVCIISTTTAAAAAVSKASKARKNKSPPQQQITRQEWRFITMNLDTFTIVHPQIDLPWLTPEETVLDFVMTAVMQETATRLVICLTTTKIRVYSLSTSQEMVALQLPPITASSLNNKNQKQQQAVLYTKLTVCPSLRFIILFNPTPNKQQAKGYEPLVLHMTHLWDGLKPSKYKATSSIGNIPDTVMSRVPANFLEKYPELFLPAQDTPLWIRSNELMLMISQQIVLPHRVLSTLQSDSSAESLLQQQQQHDLELEIEEMIHEMIDDAVTESVFAGEDERRRRLIIQVFPSKTSDGTTPNIGVVTPTAWPPARLSLALQKRQRADEVESVQQQASEIFRQRTEEQLKKVEELPGLEDWVVAQPPSSTSTVVENGEDAKQHVDEANRADGIVLDTIGSEGTVPDGAANDSKEEAAEVAHSTFIDQHSVKSVKVDPTIDTV